MSCITEGFKKCEIYPLNPNATDKSLLLRSTTETNPEDLDWSLPSKTAALTVTSDSTSAASDASELIQSVGRPAIEQTNSITADLPTNSQYVADSQMSSSSLSELSSSRRISVEFVADVANWNSRFR